MATDTVEITIPVMDPGVAFAFDVAKALGRPVKEVSFTRTCGQISITTTVVFQDK